MTQTAVRLPSEEYGPPLRGRARRLAGRRRALTVALVIVAVLVLGASATFGALMYFGTSGSIVDLGRQRQTAETDIEATGPVLAGVEGVTNVLLVGSDSREGLTEDELLELGTDDDERDDSSGLTDTIMLVQLDAEEGRASVLSFPRDLLVTHCDGTRGRINAAFKYGEELEEGNGARCLVETVTGLTGVFIHHYVQVDFQGFIRAVDELGGVTFYVDEPLVDERAGLDIPAGCVTFDGPKALSFVRARYLDPEADLGRVARQQRFLREMVNEAASFETLSNPSRLLGFVGAVGDSITTDAELSSAFDRANLVWTFRKLSNDGIDTHVVPAYDDEWNGASVLVADEEAAEALFAQFRAGSFSTPEPSVPPPAAEPTAPGTAAPVVPPPAPELAPAPSPTFAGATPSTIPC